jgi:Tol biopolymer transport system component
LFSNWGRRYGRLLAAFACFAHEGAAQRVTSMNGDVYLISPSGQEQMLTSSGRDSDPALSEDGEKVAFVRTIRDRPDASGLGRAVDESDIDVINLADSKREIHVLLGSPVSVGGRQFRWFSSPRFSLDGKSLYIMIPDYSTVSPGLVSLNIATGKITFLASALKYWVLLSGAYKGDLIVWQNPMLVGGGRYDVFNLISSAGEVLGVVAFDQAAVEAFIASQNY